MTTFSDLIASVRDRLGDYEKWATSTAEGDGSKNTFQLNDYPIVADTVSLTVAGSTINETTVYPPSAGYFYLDYDTGMITVGTTPSAAQVVASTYKKTRWDDDLVKDAVNFGIDYVGGAFYREYTDTSIVLDMGVLDYPIGSSSVAVERIKMVKGFDNYYLLTLDNWRLDRAEIHTFTADTSVYLPDADSTSLVIASGDVIGIGEYLKDAAQSEIVLVTSVSDDGLTLTVARGRNKTTAIAHASGATWSNVSDTILHFDYIFDTYPIQVTYVARPTGLSALADTLETTAGIPARAKEPIILYACYWLLSAGLGSRMRKNMTRNPQTIDYVTRDMDTVGTKFKMMGDMAASRLKMPKLNARAVR
jgi:hypothetical protein